MNNLQQGAIKKSTLTEDEIAAIEQLTAICNAYEHLHMRFNQEMQRSRPGNTFDDFLYYDNGTLVGYLIVYNFGNKEKECTGMVHPDHRRKGIFSQLLDIAKAECASRGVQKLILICEHSSSSGQAFVQTIGPQDHSSEHEMVLGTFHETLTFDDRLTFRRASSNDIFVLVNILVQSFDDPVEDTLDWVTNSLQKPDNYFYLTTFGDKSVGCSEPVGCLRLHETSDEIGIYGFGVRPEYRRRGYGRQMLEEVIHTIRDRSNKGIMLDVATTNTNAINLYRSTGFEIKTTYDYYSIIL